ncbi:hypothetical protein GON03_11115 [Nocardioides sp. MAH-18]|uniref:O-antigen ligase family protein n=1 Tax=Nocardioides agri TaxID=2682843 RepID=A0A6L6XSF4_9ACTN|nr:MULTISPECIES: hypothetical protein [unclassified Nocardioides]MBA2954878.1 hypothetical protein [Nocardioides sp. CGMCC 1.13656]MVQ49732.1 hypothetical protein [Nocardioides sp. MAH-18]
MTAAPVVHDSRLGAMWTVIIALDFFWLSNPMILFTFHQSLGNAAAVTLAGLLVTPGRSTPRAATSVVALLAFGLASSLWSFFSRLTVDYTLIYICVAVVATVVAVTVDARTVAQGMLLGGVLIVVGSYLALQLDYPGAAIPLGGTGYMAGVGMNRNILGYTLVLSLAFAVGFIPRLPWARVLWAVGTGVVLLGVGVAQSGTSYVAAAVVVALAIALAGLDRWHPPSAVRSARRRWGIRAVTIVLLAGAVAGIYVVADLLDRDLSSLTGRVPLWKAVWTETTGLDRWFGAGWGVVWPHPWHPAPANATLGDIVERAGIFLEHGHSSLFDLIPEIGLVGAALMALVYVQAVARGLAHRDSRAVNAGRLEASRLALLSVIALLVLGLTEPLSVIPLGWFVIVILATGLSPASLDTDRPEGEAGATTAAPGRRRAGAWPAR